MKTDPSVHDSWDGLAKSKVGFPRCLPSRIILRHSVKINIVKEGIAFTRGQTSVKVNASGEALNFLKALSPIDPTSSREVVDDLAIVLEILLSEGILGDADFDRHENSISGFALIGILNDLVEEFFDTNADALKLASDLSAGKASQELVKGWLLENYLYTCSAKYHIEPVINTVMDPNQKLFWKEFLEDESEHWRIYFKLFKELAWDPDKARELQPLPGTSGFIEGLRGVSMKGQVPYASVLSFIEKAPDVALLEEDPLFSSLYKYYGFPMHSVRPLWAHAVHNGAAAHDLVGTRVLASVPVLTPAEQVSVISANLFILNAIKTWHTGICHFYSNPKQAQERFATILK